MMTLIHSVILCLIFQTCSLQLHSGKEIFNDAEFSISVTKTTKVAAGGCTDIQYSFTIPTDKVTAPYKKIWFREDPKNIESEEIVEDVKRERQDGILEIKALPRGQHEYGLKLEWGCNQAYVFPDRIWICVSDLTQNPTVIVPAPLREGHTFRIECRAPVLCSGPPDLYWRREKTEVPLGLQRDYYQTSMLLITPRADDHNTKLTCVANYNFSSTQTTVTLAVEFAPKILNGSRCTFEGKLLVCICISWGNPRPPIIWPLTSLTDYSVTSSSSDQTVESTVTMPAADYNNSSVRCVTHNELGAAEMDIPIYSTASEFRFQVFLPWIITGVSLSLNGILVTILILCTYKRAKSRQMELREEMNTYVTLRREDIEQVYSVISPRNA